MKLDVDQVMGLGPCPPWTRARVEDLYAGRATMGALDFLREGPSRLPWEDCLWVLRNGRLVQPRLWVLWAVDCAARALPAFERRCPGDVRPRRALAAAAGHAAGLVSREDVLQAASDADAAADAADAARAAVAAADSAADRSAADTAADATRSAAYATYANYGASAGGAMRTEQAWQRGHLASLVERYQPVDWDVRATTGTEET